MTFSMLKFWHIFTLISGAIVACVMALASVSYNASLGTSEPAFGWLPIANNMVFASLAFAFDLRLIASVFGFWHWRQRNRIAMIFCAILFIISSLFSVHSVRGYIALNLTKTLAPAARDHDVYQSVRQELIGAQKHLAALRASLLKISKRRARKQLRRDIDAQLDLVHETRARLSSAKIAAHVTPLKGLEWFLAITLWFFNATCWTAWFGTEERASRSIAPTRSNTHSELRAPRRAQHRDQGNVPDWLASYRQIEPEHCAQVYDRYRAWCAQHNLVALADRKFYAQLVDLGARKFRDGRNGPTMYALPRQPLRMVDNSEREAYPLTAPPTVAS